MLRGRLIATLGMLVLTTVPPTAAAEGICIDTTRDPPPVYYGSCSQMIRIVIDKASTLGIVGAEILCSVDPPGAWSPGAPLPTSEIGGALDCVAHVVLGDCGANMPGYVPQSCVTQFVSGCPSGSDLVECSEHVATECAAAVPGDVAGCVLLLVPRLPTELASLLTPVEETLP